MNKEIKENLTGLMVTLGTDDYIVNQYYIYCTTENSNIGYPIKYCPICGAKLE